MARRGNLNFACALCKKRCPSPSALNRHMSKHSNTKPYQCLLCSKKFKWQNSLDLHKLIHSDEGRIYYCEQCKNVKFAYKSELRLHLASVHNQSYDSKWDCIFCDKKLNSQKNFQNHINTHTKEKPNFCKFCDNEFNERKNLVIHLSIHNPNRQSSFECPLCTKRFFSNKYLQSHLKTHLLERPYKCQICNKGFMAKGDFTLHLRVHTGEKPFSCENCEKRFSDSTKKLRHSRTCKLRKR